MYSPCVLFFFTRWRGNPKTPVHYGKRCDTCVALLDSKGPYFINNQRKKVVPKVKTFEATEKIRDGTVLLNTSNIQDEQVLKLALTHINYFQKKERL